MEIVQDFIGTEKHENRLNLSAVLIFSQLYFFKNLILFWNTLLVRNVKYEKIVRRLL